MPDSITYKSNALVRASHKLTLQEQCLLLLCISRLKPGADAELQKTMIIIAAEYLDSFPDMGRKNAEVQLREAIDRLWGGLIILKNDEKREEFRRIRYRVQYVKGKAKARITFSDAVTPCLTRLEGQLTRAVIKNISGLPSSYSIRIYEFLQQLRSTGGGIIALSDFRSVLGIESKYKQFRDLDKILVEPCINELNKKSDLAITIETIKRGRTVITLRLRLKEDKQVKMAV